MRCFVFAPFRTFDKWLFRNKLAGPNIFFGDTLDPWRAR